MNGQAYSILPRFAVDNPDETARIGCMVAERGYHLLGVTRDGRGIVGPDPLEYGAVKSVPAQKQGTAQALLAEVRVYAENNGLDLVGWNPDTRTATFAILTPVVRALRARWAALLGVQPHDIDVHVVYAVGEPRVDRIVARIPSKAIAEDRRAGILGELSKALRPLGFTSGWDIAESEWTGAVTFTYGAEERLPGAFPLADIMPDRYDPEQWAFSAFGKDVNGQPAGHDLNLAPHVALAGPTGAGKTYAINAMLASRAARGHRLLIVDPAKALDFPWARDYALAVAETYPEAHAAMRWVQEENERRKVVLKQYDAQKWRELTAEQRAEHDIYPLTVIADELATALDPWKVESSLQKGTPEHARQVALSEAKNALDTGLNEIAATMRAVGVYGIFATQKMLVTSFGPHGSTLRSNSGHKTYLHPTGSKVNRADVRLLFDSTADGDSVADLVEQLDEPGVFGLAATVASSRMSAIRVADAAAKGIPGLLASLGVPKVTPLNLSGTAPAPAAAPVVGLPAAVPQPTPSAAPAAWQ